MNKDFEPRFLTLEEAEGMISKEDRIHTLRQAGIALIGADWSREQIIEAFKTKKPQLSGKTATNMGHGIAFLDDNESPVFVETVAELKPAENNEGD